MPSFATTHSRPAMVLSCRAKTGMNAAGRCWVTRIGTPILLGSPWNRTPSAWIPPVDAPTARMSIGSAGIARSCGFEPAFGSGARSRIGAAAYRSALRKRGHGLLRPLFRQGRDDHDFRAAGGGNDAGNRLETSRTGHFQIEE